MLEARIAVCEKVLQDLELNLSHLTPDLIPKYDKLVSILRSLSGCNVRSKFPDDEVDDYLAQLKELEQELREYGIHAYESTGSKEEKLSEMTEKLILAIKNPEPAPEAKKLIETLLQRCFVWVATMKKKYVAPCSFLETNLTITRRGNIAVGFKDTYDKLLEIRNKLEKLSLTQAWSLRETDLYSYQRMLDRVDESRAEDGNFYDALGRPAEIYEQRTLLYLLRKSYATIYHLLVSSEPVSEALLPIFNQLVTLKKCLIEVKKNGGVSSPRELYPYSMKLNSIDNMRVDGKFMVGDDIPDGQGSVMQLLEQCFELAYELRNDAEDSGSGEKSEGSQTDDERVPPPAAEAATAVAK